MLEAVAMKLQSSPQIKDYVYARYSRQAIDVVKRSRQILFGWLEYIIHLLLLYISAVAWKHVCFVCNKRAEMKFYSGNKIYFWHEFSIRILIALNNSMAISYQRPAIGYQSNFRYQRNLNLNRNRNRNQKTMKAKRLNGFDNQQELSYWLPPRHRRRVSRFSRWAWGEVLLALLPLCGGNIVAARL